VYNPKYRENPKIVGGIVELRLWVRKTREAKRMARTGAYNPVPSHVGRVLLSSYLGSCGWIGREEVREAET